MGRRGLKATAAGNPLTRCAGAPPEGEHLPYLSFSRSPTAAWAAARRAIGTR
jgi:hypothetical protein